MSEPRRLIKDACVVTMDAALGAFDRPDILIEGARVRESAPTIAADDCEEIDASAMIAMPGLVDTHRHSVDHPVAELRRGLHAVRLHDQDAHVLPRALPSRSNVVNWDFVASQL